MTTENTERGELFQLMLGRTTTKAVERILAAGFTKRRQVTTVEELDALGFQAVVLDAYDTPHVCERFRTDGKRAEWQPSGMNQLLESEDILYHGPATVLYSPVVPGE